MNNNADAADDDDDDDDCTIMIPKATSEINTSCFGINIAFLHTYFQRILD